MKIFYDKKYYLLQNKFFKNKKIKDPYGTFDYLMEISGSIELKPGFIS